MQYGLSASLCTAHLITQFTVHSGRRYIHITVLKEKQKTQQLEKFQQEYSNVLEMTTSSTIRDDILARRMFFLGLALLPWLWVVNVLYFWDDVYGPCSWWCIRSPSSSDEEPSPSTALTSRESSDRLVGEGAGTVSNMGPSEIGPTAEAISVEVSKWVRRSTLGSLVMFLALVAWMTIIQTNRDRFGPKWFIIDLNDAERTGW